MCHRIHPVFSLRQAPSLKEKLYTALKKNRHKGGRDKKKNNKKIHSKDGIMLLKYGDTGSLTELLQLALSRAGYYTGNIDGIFAEKTLSAVRAFQRAFFLKEDGIAGEKTFEKAARFIKGYYTREIKKGGN